MSAFLERRQRPLGNTFIEEESESECETSRRMPPVLRRRYTFSHITLSHEEREVDVASLRRFASKKSTVLPPNKASAAQCLYSSTEVDPLRGDNSPSSGSFSKVIFLCNTLSFNTAAVTGTGDLAAPQMPWAADIHAAPAEMATRIPCLPLDSLIPPQSPTVSPDHSEPRTPMETWTWMSEDQDTCTWASDCSDEPSSSSLDFFPSSVPPSSEASRRSNRPSASSSRLGQAGVKVGSDTVSMTASISSTSAIGAAATATAGVAAAVQRQRTSKGKQKKAVSPASSSTASTTGSSPSSCTSAPVVEKSSTRQQPRADLVKELRRTGASALERAAALAKELPANRP